MVAPTQSQVDNAVLKIKGMQYKLAWELVKEDSYGGDISCCIRKLKLFWLWRKALSCVVAGHSTTSIFVLSISGGVAARTFNVSINGSTISGTVSSTSADIAVWMALIAFEINAYGVATAVYDTVANDVIITYPEPKELAISITHTNTMSVGNATFTNIVPTQGCLSDDKVFNLIGKINNACK